MDNLELVKDMKLLLGIVSELRLEVDALRKELRLKDGKDDMLTLKEACDYLRIGRTAMYRRLDNGEISFAVKRGKDSEIASSIAITPHTLVAEPQ